MVFLSWRPLFMFLSVLLHCAHLTDVWAPSISASTFNKIDNVLYFDDSSKMLLQSQNDVFFSSDNGKSWSQVAINSDSGEELIVLSMQEFDYNNKMAMLFTSSNRQFYTFDQGETWQFFDLPFDKIAESRAQLNYANNNYILLSFLAFNEDSMLIEHTFYSKDGLLSPPIELESDSIGDCTFTKLNPDFVAGADERIVCFKKEYDVFNFLKSSKIIATEDFFENILFSSNNELENTRILRLKVVNSFLIAIVSSDRYISNGYLDFYVSKDGLTFVKSFFEQQVRDWMFSILPSTSDSLYLAVFGSKNSKDNSPATDIYKSDSDGKFFDKIFGDVLSNILGMSLVSKVESLDGVWIAAHDEGYDSKNYAMNTKSMITFDDGGSWNLLNITDDDSCLNSADCSLHISWVTERSGDGKIVTGETPGILVGVGNTGKYSTTDISKLKTYISRDAGMSWKKISDKPSIFQFGDLGNIIITIPVSIEYFYSGVTDNYADYFTYSLDQGDTWEEVKIDTKLVPLFFVTNKDNSDKAILLVGINGDTKEYVTYSIDFSGAFDRTCTDEDFEEWEARVDPISKQPTCVYGHSEKFLRRKMTANCFVNKVYEDLKVIEQPCQCSVKDSECSYGFRMNEDDECEPLLALLAKKFCKDNKGKVKVSSRRKIPGNLCVGGYIPPEDDYTLSCKDALDSEKSSEISVKVTEFHENIMYYQYLELDPTADGVPDETLIVYTSSRNVYISYDGGETFVDLPVFAEDKGHFIYIFLNPYFPNQVYLVTDLGNIYYSNNRALGFQKFTSPYVSSSYNSFRMSFNKQDPATFIWFADTDCDSLGNCRMRAAITKNNGETFTHLVDNVKNCIFAQSLFDLDSYNVHANLIICDQKVDNQLYYRLISSIDEFATAPEVEFDKIIGSTTSGKYFITARLNDNNSLTAFVSVDGNTYAEVKFPHDLQISKQTAYTILDVNSPELFMHVTTNDELGYEFGALLKANYNGTLYSTSMRHVNRNKDAYVDYESVTSLEGLSLINVVINYDEASAKKEEKKLASMISHNDAASWSLLPAPKIDSEGQRYKCKACSLHLHSYTERVDPGRDTFSSSSALGMLFGLGNVGTSLSPMEDGSTALFFSRDGGISWKEVAKGRYIWEFGDQGTILIIVPTGIETNIVKYSLDMGDSWQEYQFSPNKYLVEDISTVPSDSSRRFMLIVKDKDVSNSIFSLDFTKIYPRQCELLLNENGERKKDDDYEYFTPKHPSLKDSCLFGHESKYLRRLPNKDCFIGKAPLEKGYRMEKNCACTREDYECDYNYELNVDGTCKLVKGLEGFKGDEVCKDSNVDEWFEATGYRKLEASTCDAGLILDKWISHTCPGKQSKNNGVGGWGMFFVFFIPMLAFAGCLAVVYEKGIRRNGGFSRLGEIRLDDDDNLHLVEENRTDKIINEIVKVGVWSFHLMGKGWRNLSQFFNKFRGDSAARDGSIGAFFNDRVEEEDPLFWSGDDEDAREIGSFLEHGDSEGFNDFETHEEPVPDDEDFRIDDDDDDDDNDNSVTS